MVLRHKPESIGITLDSEGWVDVDVLLKACSKNEKFISLEQLKLVVEENDKQRFALSPDGKRIRASQGHSVQVELGYHGQCPPEILYHGTATRFLESIRKEGLLKRQRNHVHLSATTQTATSVGARHGKVVVLKVDAKRMHEEGHQFFLSANGVWLTERVPPEFIEF
jgi:RNA:NAD 2''-phosphotransferase